MARCEILGNTLALPQWLAEPSVGARHLIAPFGAKLDPNSFYNRLGVKIQPSGSVAQFATTIPLAVPISTPLPSVVPLSAAGNVLIYTGSVIMFNNGSDGKFAVLSAPAKIGDTSISVLALPTALVATDVALWNTFEQKFVPGGLIIGRTPYGGTGTGVFEVGDPLVHPEMGLLLYDVVNLTLNNNAEMLKPNAATSIKINYLFDYASMTGDPTLIVDPVTAPTLTETGSSGTLVAGTYFVGVSFGNAEGETKISPLSSVAITSTGEIHIASYAFPTNATYMKTYVSPYPGNVGVQYQTTIAAAAAQTLASVAPGGNPNTGNNSNTTGSLYARQFEWLFRNFNIIYGKD